MSHIEFDESKLKYLLDKSKEVAETVSQSFRDLNALEENTEGEFGRSYGEISTEINHIVHELDGAHKAKISIEQKIANAHNRIQPIPDIPPQPANAQAQSRYAEEIARAEQERQRVESNNDRLRAEISRLESYKMQLEAGIAELDRCWRELRAEQESLISAQNNFNSVRSHNNGLFQKNINNVGLFCNALNESCNRAEEVVQVKSNYGLDSQPLKRYFTVNAAVYSTGIRSERKAATSSTFSSSDRESGVGGGRNVLVIKERQREKVFEMIATENSPILIKIPAANMYSLGGQAFIDKMKAESFNLLKNNGSIIGSDGYITWEK